MRNVKYRINVATCECCSGMWEAPAGDVSLMQGACMDCQRDSDTEKPLRFARLDSVTPAYRSGMTKLPKRWFARVLELIGEEEEALEELSDPRGFYEK